MLVSLVVFYPAVGFVIPKFNVSCGSRISSCLLGVTLGSRSSPLPSPNQNPELLLVPWPDCVSPLNPKSLL